MESVAYLHLALTYEEYTNTEPVAALAKLKHFPDLHTNDGISGVLASPFRGGWGDLYVVGPIFEFLKKRKLSSRAWMHWLSVAVVICVLGVANRALAALEFGASGSEVSALQERLQQLGYFKAGITGNYGFITRDAVIQFQKDKKLKPTGVIDPETEKALVERKKSTSTVSQPPAEFLGQGDRGQTVQAIQQSLRGLGLYSGSVNGVFDSSTAAAVRAFQKSQGLTADGIVGPQTKAKLPRPVSKTKPQPQSSTPKTEIFQMEDKGKDVAKIQQRLRDLGYFRGSMTGNFDQETKDAVVKFQQARKLPSDGIVGPITLAALNEVVTTSNSSVQALQNRLKAKGFYKGPIDGTLNAQTKAAIAAAQESYGVSSNAIMNGGL